MRAVIMVIYFCLFFVSCKKEQSAISYTQQTYTDSHGTSVNFTKCIWLTTIVRGNNDGFWNLALLISGSTNADRITIVTTGDGLLAEQNLVLDLNKNFVNDTIGIEFFHYSGAPPSGSFSASTVVKAYRGSDTLVVKLSSGIMDY